MPQPNPAIDAVMGPRDWALVAVLSVLWGGSFLFVGVAVREIPPVLLVTARVMIAALALHGVLRLTGTPFPHHRAAWAAFLGMGLLNNAIPFTLIAWGQAHIASGLAAILNATTPLFTVIVAHWLTQDERMRGSRLAGVAVGFCGVAVMVGADALRDLGVDVAAQLAVLAAALSYAFAGVFGRRFRRLGIPPLATAAGQVSASSLMLAPVALLVAPPWTLPMPGAGALLALVSLALLSTALAYILFFRVLASAGATNAAIVTFLIPVSAILLGAVVLGERLEPRHLAGMALIGLGLAVIDGRPGARLSAALRPRA
ncbi:DMT family transporter [Salinarimonas soli]|uniref:EamA family transporter n=1 Tax=Salinarimonas soli TaxID=1638099 RepID=A0A5B2UZD9_9HYPH|nr:EamA family transporter [Salinarimonas soli]KAA2232136.1 EamA family transporter [Salinarimonas soli]